MQKPGRMRSETTFANPRCGPSFPKLKRDWNVTAVRKQQRPMPEILWLRSSNCQEIRTHNSHRHLWLRLRHSRQKGKSRRSGVRPTAWLLPALWPWASWFPTLNLSFPHLVGLAATCTKGRLQDWTYRRCTIPWSCYDEQSLKGTVELNELGVSWAPWWSSSLDKR